ncbi:tyrosine--tRNA ligase, partial [candidate division WOR-3 bacterium]|nr:tyrosine--tRNA ligase [candidate division WOR-3 bacterium]
MKFDQILEKLVINFSRERKISDRSAKKQAEIFLEKTDQVYTGKDLEKKIIKAIKSKKPLIIKYGVDPTAEELHLGHWVILKKLQVLQQLGHQIVFLIGDFTAMIGDPSGRTSAREPLTEKEVKANVRKIVKQIRKFLTPDKIVYNSHWFK